MPRRITHRRKRTAANTRAPTVRKPYGGKMNNDAYVRVEQSIQLVAFDGDTAFMRFRTQQSNGVPAQNTYIGNSPEFQYHRRLYGFYEVMGMGCTTTLYPESYCARADMFAGPFPGIAATGQQPAVPTYDNLEGAALHTQVKLNGTKSKIYYAYSKDLKNIGSQFAFPTGQNTVGNPPDGSKAAIVVLVKRTNQVKQVVQTSFTRVDPAIDPNAQPQFVVDNQLDNAWSPGDVIGEMVFVSYIRFHARVTNSIITLFEREAALGRAAMAATKQVVPAKKCAGRPRKVEVAIPAETDSMMSYAELQGQLATLMSAQK